MKTENKNNKIDYIEFPVHDQKNYQKTKRFFTKIFGWKYQDWGEDYADTKDSGIGSGLNADGKQNTKNPLVVIYVENIEAVKNEVENHGGKIIKDIFEFPGGKRFHFIDPSGNELSVWSDK